MSKISLTRRLLQRLHFAEVKKINLHFDLPPRRSKEEMIGQCVRKLGSGLDELVCAGGPYSLAEWNQLLIDFGGYPRKSFSAAVEEFRISLDPVFDDFDGDTPIIDLRGQSSMIRTLARKLGVSPDSLAEALGKVHGRTLLGSFVTDFRQKQRQILNPEAQTRGTVHVASTRTVASNVTGLAEADLYSFFSGADEIAIAAGFYECDLIYRLLVACPSAKRVRFVFNGLGGIRLKKQCEELAELMYELSRDGRTVDVRLAFEPGMFHSKLYIASRRGQTRALVGSANATTAAFTRNEEILVSLEDGGALVSYFEAIWSKASPLNGIDTTARSLIAFFRTGTLYFRPVVSLSTSLNPFRELIRLMSPEERAKLGGLSLPHADRESGIGAFNLKLAVQEATGGEVIPDAIDEAENNSTARLSIRPWSVETCFGYWVPASLDDKWQVKLDEASARKQQKWMEFRTALGRVSLEELTERYREYLSAVDEAFAAVPEVKRYISTLQRDPFDVDPFSKFVDRVVRYLEDDDRIRRLARPYTSGPVPEIWEDLSAYKDFCESFFDSLFRVARLTERQPFVPGRILARADASELYDPELLRSKLEDYLYSPGWKDEDWE